MLAPKRLSFLFALLFEQFHCPMSGKANTKKREQSLLPCPPSKCWVLGACNLFLSVSCFGL